MGAVVNVALFGTSLTTGHLNRGWPVLLQSALQAGKKTSVRVHARGGPGWSSADLLAAAPRVARMRDNVVIVDCYNDINPAFHLVRAGNINAILDVFESANPSVTLFLMSMLRPVADTGEAALFALMRDIAIARGVGYINGYSAWGNPALHPEEYGLPDGHPSLSSYQRVAIPEISTVVRPLYA